MSDPVLYREYSPNAPWVRWLFWGSMTGAALGVVTQGDLSPGGRLAVLGGLGAFAFALDRFLLGLTVEVHRSRLRFGLGDGSLIKSSVGWDEIEGLASVTYRPIRDFGGWGVRGFGRRRAWTAAGNQAVRLDLKDGRELYIGSERPHRLEERIRAAMGTAGGTGG